MAYAETGTRIKDEYLAGASLEALAEKHGGAVGTIRNTLRRQGVVLRPPGKAAKPLSPTKVCSACGNDLPRSEFSREGRRTSECKGCTNEKQNDRYRSDEGFRQQKIASAKASADRRVSAVPLSIGHHRRFRRWPRRPPRTLPRRWRGTRGRCPPCTPEGRSEARCPLNRAR